MVSVSALVSIAVLGASPQLPPQGPWQERWEATEVMLPMRDGTKLLTVYYVPKGKPGPFPILMERTPYGAGSATRAPRARNQFISNSGDYILAFQDVRGRGRSEGEFINVKPTLAKGAAGTDESTDTFDTVEYMIKNVPKNSGRVGLWGISYPGFYAGAGGIRNHPALTAISPQAPVNDWFMGDDVQHRGAFFLQETFDFCIGFDANPGQRITVDREGMSAYDFFLKAGALSNYESKFIQGKMDYWKELMDNDTENKYWKDRALWRSFKDVKCAVLTVGGWFDKEDMWGALNLYKAGEKQNPGTPNFLVMGPWSHGQWAGSGSRLGDLTFGSDTSAWYEENIEFPFFEKYLRATNSNPPAEANVFETGINTWQTFSEWPPKAIKPLSVFLEAGRRLALAKPTKTSETGYIYDPAKPTPYLADYANSRRASGDWLAKDQAFLDARTDTATYEMSVNQDLRVAGPITADLWIKTTGTDCDLVVQVIDQAPEGSTGGTAAPGVQYMVRGEIMRAKFRNSFEKPEAIKPNTPTRVKFELNDVMHTFKKGHKMIVRIQSSWFPIADRNPNTFVSRANQKDSDFKPAKITILHGGQHSSRIELGKL